MADSIIPQFPSDGNDLSGAKVWCISCSNTYRYYGASDGHEVAQLLNCISDSFDDFKDVFNTDYHNVVVWCPTYATVTIQTDSGSAFNGTSYLYLQAKTSGSSATDIIQVGKITTSGNSSSSLTGFPKFFALGRENYSNYVSLQFYHSFNSNMGYEHWTVNFTLLLYFAYFPDL